MLGFEIMLTCLALNVYKEARGEPVLAQQAVALVTLNRTKQKQDRHVCDVVFAPSQFSWTITDVSNGVLKPRARPDRNTVEWKRAEQSALSALYIDDFTKGATHYHTVGIRPYWLKDMEFLGTWGSHHFYRGKK